LTEPGTARATAAGPARIAEAFQGHGRRAALMPYVMGGFPDREASLLAARACADAGADLMELGVPFSDPLADGPVIHAAATEALAGGVTVDDVLRVCARVADRLPVALMVYVNAVLAPGAEDFCRTAADAGACALIVPDLPHDEGEDLRSACEGAGLALVPLAAPNTAEDRLREIGAQARGFVYTVSVAGTTGERGRLPEGLAETVERVRAVASVPVAVGFGISTADQAHRVAEVADGVIVGSRIVRAAGEGGADAVREVVGELGDALS
jgi:tryptophan synthase alpha chain